MLVKTLKYTNAGRNKVRHFSLGLTKGTSALTISILQPLFSARNSLLVRGRAVVLSGKQLVQGEGCSVELGDGKSFKALKSCTLNGV